MKYAVLIYRAPDEYDGFSDDERAAVRKEYVDLTQDPRVIGSGQLEPATTATTVRVQDGRTLTTDGPFADTKEVFGGYYLVDADNLDDVLDMAARLPAARLGGSVEVRPMMMVMP